MFLNGYPYTDFHELNADFLLKNYKLLLDSLKQIDSWIETHQEAYEDLKKIVDQLENGILPDAVYVNLKKWIEENFYSIVSEMIKFVTFGITDSGYFVVNIPVGFGDIVFNTTGLDIITPLQPEYGHLTLSY